MVTASCQQVEQLPSFTHFHSFSVKQLQIPHTISVLLHPTHYHHLIHHLHTRIIISLISMLIVTSITVTIASTSITFDYLHRLHLRHSH
jgi:hypothetical protein